MILGTPPLGLARLPKSLREALEQRAAAAVAAVEILEHEAVREEAEYTQAEADSALGESFRATLARERMVGTERGELLQLSEALEHLAEAIIDARGEMREAPAAHRERLIEIAGILRDLVRTAARSVGLVERDSSERDPLHTRAHELRDELRASLRVAQSALVLGSDDVLSVVRVGSLLRRLSDVGAESARTMRAVELLASAHD